MADVKETSIDMLSDEQYCTVCSTQPKYIEDILLLHDKYPNDVKIINQSYEPICAIIAQVPKSWFRFIKPPKKMNLSEEERQLRAERLKKGRNKNDLD